MKHHKLMWGIVILIVVSLIGIQSFSSLLNRKPHNHSPQVRSLVKLRSVAQACIIYSGNHKDQFPDPERWVELLVESGYADPDYFASRTSDPEEFPYVYLPEAVLFDSESILLYELPHHWPDYVNVAFADASTEMIPHDEFHRMLAEQTSESP